MKNNHLLILIMVSLWIFNCSSKKNENSAEGRQDLHQDGVALIERPIADTLPISEIPKEERKPIKVDIQALLSFYNEIDSFPFSMPYDAGLYNYASKTSKFKGTEIPLKHCAIFDSSLNVSKEYSQSGIYAIRSFKIDSGTIGLLTKQTGNDTYSINLFLLDINKKVIINNLVVTEFWGDDGQAFNTESIIKRLARNKFLIDLHKRDCRPDEKGEKSICVDSIITHRLIGSKLVLIKKRKIRT